MDFQKEFVFFLQILQQAGVRSVEFRIPAQGDVEIDAGLRRKLGAEPSVFAGCRALFPHFEQGSIYQVTDCFFLQYLFFLLPGGTRCMAVGPYLSMQPSRRQIYETAELCGLSPAAAHLLEEFYPNVPHITDDSPFYAMVHCLCRNMYGCEAQVYRMKLDDGLTASLRTRHAPADDLTTVMRRLESRYEAEDELLRIVMQGDRAKVRQVLRPAGIDAAIEARLADPVRNRKNYCIILNTLLRKAAQRGGVHPFHVDDLSKNFAAAIEQAATSAEIDRLVMDMADQYCLLVQRCGTAGYTPPVQRAMVYVRQNLSETLNLHVVAAELGCNASYFSARFKRETGQTLTEFILSERMRLAAGLLRTTRLQVQTVAQYCGFLDINYFSRLFRQTAGCSPTEFRKTGRALQT